MPRRASIYLAVLVATLGLAYTGTAVKRPASDGGGVMGTVPQGAPAAPKDIPAPASQIPGQAPVGEAPASSAPATTSTPGPAKADDIPK